MKLALVNSILTIFVCANAALANEIEVSTTSLIQASRDHQVEARKIDPGAYLFSVHTSLDPHEPTWMFAHYQSAFAHPADDMNYLAGWSGQGPGQFFIDPSPYNRVDCGPVPRPTCGDPTGEPEKKVLHPEITNWQVDLAQIKKILLANKIMFDPETTMHIHVTTMIRLRAFGILPDIREEDQERLGQELLEVMDRQVIIQLVDNWAPGHSSRYVLIDGTTGKVLATGLYDKMPPRPGAVSSGG